MQNLNLQSIPSPCFVVDEVLVERNLQVIDRVQQATGAKILLALKGFAMWSLAPLIRRYLPGTTCSGLHEALLGREEFGGEVHVYAPAFTDDEIDRVLDLADHISFNSFPQWERFGDRIASHPNPPRVGLRINPEHREVAVELYDPCAPYSRLGITAEHFEGRSLRGISGLHFHTLCELNSDALERTLKVVEQKFSRYFGGLSWINFGGGHHITRADYDIDRLIAIIHGFQARHPHLQVYLEPGEAIALGTGVLVATVLDLIDNGMPIAILDTSATAHMPDTLEMPYRPMITGSGMPDEKPHTYRLGGLTCLAGDVIGDYSFDRPLQVGDRLIFEDMAHYTMVKTTTFNGVPHPAIAIHHSDTGRTRVIKQFGYEDYRDRLS
jgi:carboxynorspermidine decarboxylase